MMDSDTTASYADVLGTRMGGDFAWAEVAKIVVDELYSAPNKNLLPRKLELSQGPLFYLLDNDEIDDEPSLLPAEQRQQGSDDAKEVGRNSTGCAGTRCTSSSSTFITGGKLRARVMGALMLRPFLDQYRIEKAGGALEVGIRLATDGEDHDQKIQPGLYATADTATTTPPSPAMSTLASPPQVHLRVEFALLRSRLATAQEEGEHVGAPGASSGQAVHGVRDVWRRILALQSRYRPADLYFETILHAVGRLGLGLPVHRKNKGRRLHQQRSLAEVPVLGAGFEQQQQAEIASAASSSTPASIDRFRRVYEKAVLLANLFPEEAHTETDESWRPATVVTSSACRYRASSRHTPWHNIPVASILIPVLKKVFRALDPQFVQKFFQCSGGPAATAVAKTCGVCCEQRPPPRTQPELRGPLVGMLLLRPVLMLLLPQH
eukprot:g3875.t1